MTKFIVKTVNIVFVVMLTVIIFSMGMVMGELMLSDWAAFGFGVALVAFLAAFLLLLRKPLMKRGKWIYDFLSNVSERELAVFLFLFVAVTKIAFVFIFDNDMSSHVDFGKYKSFAQQFAEGGRILKSTGYAFKYKYTVIYGLVLSPFAKLFGTDTKVFTCAISVMNAIAMVLLFDILKRYVGKEKAFFMTFLYSVVPMGLFQTQILTHENGLFFFHILAIWIYLKAFDKKNKTVLQIVYVLLSCCVLAVGKSVNASGRVLFISFGIYAVAKIFENGFDKKKLTKIGCVLLVLFVTYSGSAKLVDHIVVKTVEGAESMQNDSKRLPYGWAVYLGLNSEWNGLWNYWDYKTYEKYNKIEDKEEALQYQRDLIKNRFQEYIDSPLKMPIHLFRKVRVLWGEQTLPFGYELGNAVNHFMYRGYKGAVFRTVTIINRLSFMSVYIMLLFAMIKELKKKTYEVTPALHFKMAIIGVTLALLMFEVTPKYATHLQVFYFCLLAMSLDSFFGFELPRFKKNANKNAKALEKE